MLTQIKQNLHIHTALQSGCAKPEMTIPAILQQAERLGFEVIAITDHINETDEALDFLDKQREILEKIKPGIKVLLGAEITMLGPDRPPIDAQQAAQFDFVLAACNHYHLPRVENPRERTAAGYAEHYHRMVEGAINTGFVHAIAHPWTQKYVRDIPQPEMLAAYPQDDLERIIALAGSRRIGLELNPGLVAEAIPFFKNVIRLARKHAAKFTIGSDAHRLVDLDYAVKLAPAEYDQAGFLEALGIELDDLWYSDEN